MCTILDIQTIKLSSKMPSYLLGSFQHLLQRRQARYWLFNIGVAVVLLFVGVYLFTRPTVPVDNEAWEKISQDKWQTSFQKTFHRSGWFNKPKDRLWLGGNTLKEEFLPEALKFAWNISANETVLLIPIFNNDSEYLSNNFQDNFATNPENELSLINHYDNIFSRGHDGFCFRVFSKTVDSGQILHFLRNASVYPVINKQEPL